MSNLLVELERDPFDVDEFIERLAWRATGGKLDAATFDSELLRDAFESGIKDLKVIHDTHQKKCERLEMVCKEEEKRHWLKVAELQERCKESSTAFQELDEKLDSVAAKVVYLGDQLEGVNTPRARAVEAQKLMRQFAEFLSPGPANPFTMTDPAKLYEEADVIQKLYLIAQELPANGKFDKAREKISHKYNQIEKELIEEFVRSHRQDDKTKMKEVATILSHFKGYSQVIDAFIEISQMGIFLGPNIFNDVVPLCERSQAVVNEVFSNPEHVMSRFILNIYHNKLQEHIASRLDPEERDADKFLQHLFDMYSKTVKLSNQLSASKVLGADSSFLNKLTRHIFSQHLATYISKECKELKDKCEITLTRYYDAKGHTKKQIPSGAIQEMKSNLQARIGRANINIGTLANINITMGASDAPAAGETLLSEEVAISILQESKMALQRCELLSKPGETSSDALDIFEILLHYLCIEHIDYAIELGLHTIPSSEPKSQPEIYFYDVSQQTNAICHLIEKQFVDCVIPLVISTPKHGEALKKKRDIMEQLETKLNTGLEKSSAAIIGWVRYILQTEQKKTDFKPETEDIVLANATTACSRVVRFMSVFVEKIRDSLDGNNVEAVLADLGVKFHRAIYEHLLQFQYSSVGAMVVICDVNEYRRCAAEFRVPLLSQLFEALHNLCNLLVVAPENLKQVCSGDQHVGLDRAVLMSFVQLRADYKSAKLVNQFK